MTKSLLFLCLFLVSCSGQTPSFPDFLERYETARWQQFPDWASSVGKSDFHSILVIPNEIKQQQDLAFCKKYLDSLAHFDFEKLPPTAQEQHVELQEQLNGYLQQLTKDKSYSNDPSLYNVLGAFQHVLNDTTLPLDQRLRMLFHKMKSIPAYYEAAMQNLKSPVQIKAQKAMKEHQATFLFFEQSLRDSLKQSTLSREEKKYFNRQSNRSKDLIKIYIAFCNSIHFEFEAQKAATHQN